MPRPARPIRSRRVDLYLPEDLYLRLQTILWSEVEGRVPHGDWSAFFTNLTREALDRLAASNPNQETPNASQP